MTITISSTTKVVTANGIEMRVWEGVTENGVKVQALIPRIAVLSMTDLTLFEAELKEMRPPSEEIQAWPLRMVL